MPSIKGTQPEGQHIGNLSVIQHLLDEIEKLDIVDLGVEGGRDEVLLQHQGKKERRASDPGLKNRQRLRKSMSLRSPFKNMSNYAKKGRDSLWRSGAPKETISLNHH